MDNARKNIVASSSGSEPSGEKNRTDFSELKSVFTIRNGLLESRETTLRSPAASVRISGSANLFGEQLQLMIKPAAMVGGTKELGKKDSMETSIPFVLSGTFADPKVDIDAQYLSLDEQTKVLGVYQVRLRMPSFRVRQ